MTDTYANNNDKVPCRLRVKGTFFLRSGVKQACLMLDKMFNITLGDEPAFECARCPDPLTRAELLERMRDVPACTSCGTNMATKTVPRDVVVISDELAITAGTRLCISCFAGVEYTLEDEHLQQHQVSMDQLEQDYKEGKIPYSMLVDARKRYMDEHPGTFL